MKTIGRYIVRGLLGRGGMSRVYRVSLPVIGGSMALKQLWPHPSLVDLMGMDAIREGFMAEAVTMARLRHPNVVAVHDFDEAEGRPFYVMEYFSNNLGELIGETYRTEARSRVLPIEKSLHYGRQILRGLARLHHDGIVHRDIKPYNLLITEEDRVKICDFGLSKLRKEPARAPSNLKVGSPFYAAPEQEAAPEAVGVQADIFSVGVVLYRMLTGRLPHGDEGESQGPASRWNPDLDGAWNGFLERALAPDPTQRFESCAAMSLELEALKEAWAKKKEGICTLFSPTASGGGNAADMVKNGGPPRSFAQKIPPRRAGEAFGIDALMRPLFFHGHRLEGLTPSLVRDCRTGLLWQHGGSAYPLTWTEARDHIEQLNRERFEGRTDWRLPTVPELLSIMSRPPQGTDHCLPPLFDPAQRWLWSADTSSYTAAWYVSMEMGFVARNDFSAPYFAKAVCSP
jgi:serine/threonine-protein kinase